MAYDELTAERVRAVLSRRRDVAAKRMFGGLCFTVNGNMCCAVSGKGGLLVRVGADAQERALAAPHVRPMIMAGRPASGFVRVDPDGYRTDAALNKWIERGLAFVTTLPAGGSRKSSRKSPARKSALRKSRVRRTAKS